MIAAELRPLGALFADFDALFIVCAQTCHRYVPFWDDRTCATVVDSRDRSRDIKVPIVGLRKMKNAGPQTATNARSVVDAVTVATTNLYVSGESVKQDDECAAGKSREDRRKRSTVRSRRSVKLLI